MSKCFLFRHQNDLAYGLEFRVLPQGLYDLFKSEIARRPELQAVDQLLLSKLRKMGNNERDSRRRSERRRLLNFYNNGSRQVRGQMATILLCNERCNLRVIDDPAPWGSKTEMEVFYRSWRPAVNQAFKEKYPNAQERVLQMRHALSPVRMRPGETEREAEKDYEKSVE